MNDLAALAKLAQALFPWRAQLVFIGGWAHRIHRFDPRANKLEYLPVFTRDTDLAFANNKVLTLSKATFSRVNDVTRAAARIPQNRNLTPEQIQRTCQFALEQILGT